MPRSEGVSRGAEVRGGKEGCRSQRRGRGGVPRSGGWGARRGAEQIYIISDMPISPCLFVCASVPVYRDNQGSENSIFSHLTTSNGNFAIIGVGSIICPNT